MPRKTNPNIYFFMNSILISYSELCMLLRHRNQGNASFDISDGILSYGTLEFVLKDNRRNTNYFSKLYFFYFCKSFKVFLVRYIRAKLPKIQC